ncbi:polymorphic toxin-type HINT domain-containing protein [Fodinicola feengrottensis]
MADGSSKPIGKMHVGDKIANSVPGGDRKTQAHAVGTVIVTKTDYDFVNLTIGSLDHAGHPASVGSVTTTTHHPFYDLTQAAFVEAGALHVGDRLQRPDGRTAVVLSVRPYRDTHTTTYDLTIPDLHTYYVSAGLLPVLVHNVDEDNLCKLTLGPPLTGQVAEGVAAERGDKVLPHEQQMINEFGDRNGCTACRSDNSGYKDGHWTGDHNPANKLNPNGPWTLYPHCSVCSRKQGGIVNAILRGWYAEFPVSKFSGGG